MSPRGRYIVAVFALQATAGVASTVDVLKVAEAFVNETNYTVWSDLTSNLGAISIILQYTDQHENYKAFNRKLYGTIGAKLGWNPKEGESKLS
jgi:puromycin-sensitive aminopeptidase